jgi:hypothetical protein
VHDLYQIPSDVLGQPDPLPESFGTIQPADPKFRSGHPQRFQLRQQFARMVQTRQMEIEALWVDSQGQVRDLPLSPADVEVGQHFEQLDSL